MSGLSKRNRLFVLVGICYVLIVGLLAVFIFNIPSIYRQTDEQRVLDTQQVITQAMNQSEVKTRDAMLQTLTQEQVIDLVITQDSQKIYSTMPFTNFDLLEETVNEQALTYHSAYLITTNNGETFEVWLAMYELNAQAFFEIVMIVIVIAIIILCLLVTILMASLFRHLFAPIKRLRDNIFKLREYRLSEVDAVDSKTEFDLLSSELGEFTEDLQGKMDSFGVKYTLLENELQSNREQDIYKLHLISALTHALKSPLNIAMVQADDLERVSARSAETKAEFAALRASNEGLLENINELLTIINSKEKQVSTIESVDLTKIVRETVRLFIPAFSNRDIQFMIDIPQQLLFVGNSVDMKQIVHNIISNACQYTDDGGLFELTVYEEAGNLYIISYNDKQDCDQIDFEHVFDLFYTVDMPTYTHGSGIGMYTIKRMVSTYDGSIEFAPHDAGVRLSIVIPMGEHDE